MSTSGPAGGTHRAAPAALPARTGGLPVVTAIHVAKGRRLPMRDVGQVHVEAGAGIVGDRYHGTRHRHVSVQSLEELAEGADRLGAPLPRNRTRALHDRAGTILRVLESGDVVVGDTFEVLGDRAAGVAPSG
jgi:MOSC domain-containing protein YiiM